MSDESPNAPISTSFIYVDRRKTGRGKSLNNRQKLLRRIKDSIKNSKPEDIDAAGISGSASQQNKSLNNPIRVARDALSEPTFHYAQHVGEREVILIGNDKFLKGDDFPIHSSEEDGAPQGGPGEDTEDDFIVNISRAEFFQVFFENCELPNLTETHERVLPNAALKPAGFQKSGNPGQLSVVRSYKNSLGRRLAITREDREELELLIDNKNSIQSKSLVEIMDIDVRIAVLHKKLGRPEESHDLLASLKNMLEYSHT